MDGRKLLKLLDGGGRDDKLSGQLGPHFLRMLRGLSDQSLGQLFKTLCHGSNAGAPEYQDGLAGRLVICAACDVVDELERRGSRKALDRVLEEHRRA